MPLVRTTEEFSSRRKVRYGGGGDDDNNKTSTTTTSSKQYPLTPSSTNATLTPHKAFYSKDQEGSLAYFIEFNIGDFNFDEITIRTEGNRLIVQGKSKIDRRSEELDRQFNRNFTLPDNVDQMSIKAQLDEATRMLSLIGKVKLDNDANRQQTSSSSSSSFGSSAKCGQIKENKSNSSVEYELYVGDELKDGKASVDVSGYSSLNVRVAKNSWDTFGDYSLELKRQIKLPSNANTQNIEHGLDSRSATLRIKVPLR
jgi:HSP20 family molecular chaperone IbpA